MGAFAFKPISRPSYGFCKVFWTAWLRRWVISYSSLRTLAIAVNRPDGMHGRVTLDVLASLRC